MRRFYAALFSLLTVFSAVGLTRSEEAALAETEELLGEHPSPDPRTEVLQRRVLIAGDSDDAWPDELFEGRLFPEPRTQYFGFDGFLDSGKNGAARVGHALELENFAYSLGGSYDVRERRRGMRETVDGRLCAGWTASEGHRVILLSDYARWSHALPEGHQEQNLWSGSLLGVWRARDEVTAFLEAGLGSIEQWGPAEFAAREANATLGGRFFIGSGDFLAADLAYLYSDAARCRHRGRLYLSNTYTPDRVLFISAGAGLTFGGEPLVEYGGAVRLLFGPLSLVSLVGRRRADAPEPTRSWRQIEGLLEPEAMETRVTEDYYLEYSLHPAESSTAGVRGGYRRVVNPWEYAASASGGISFSNGPPRELLVLGAYCDYELPAELGLGRLRLDYELADATPFWGPPDALPPPHFALHTLELSLEVAPLDWLTGSVALGYSSRRRDGLGGELPGAVGLDLELTWVLSEVAALSLTGTNLLDAPLFTYAGAPRDPPAVGLGLSLSW